MCDGVADCFDRSDEENCPTLGQSSVEFYDGVCINENYSGLLSTFLGIVVP